MGVNNISFFFIHIHTHGRAWLGMARLLFTKLREITMNKTRNMSRLDREIITERNVQRAKHNIQLIVNNDEYLKNFIFNNTYSKINFEEERAKRFLK